MIRFGFWIAFFVLSWPMLVATDGRIWHPVAPIASYDSASLDRQDDEIPNVSARQGQVSHAETERSPNHGSGDRGQDVTCDLSNRYAHNSLKSQLVEPSAPHCEWLPYHATAPPAGS